MPTVHRMIKCVQSRDYNGLSEILIRMDLPESGLRELCQDFFKEVAKSKDPALAYQSCYFIIQGIQKYLHDMAETRASDKKYEDLEDIDQDRLDPTEEDTIH